jgi:hypothetical protein
MVFTASPLSEMIGAQPEHPGVRMFMDTLRIAGYRVVFAVSLLRNH